MRGKLPELPGNTNFDNGIEEVVGSIPSGSTNKIKELEGPPSPEEPVCHTAVTAMDGLWQPSESGGKNGRHKFG